MERDRLGRRRSPEQERGLRPLHPRLPEEWVSKALRVAMSESDWAEFEALVARFAVMAPTQARAMGWCFRACCTGSWISRARARARPAGLDGLGAPQDAATAVESAEVRSA